MPYGAEGPSRIRAIVAAAGSLAADWPADVAAQAVAAPRPAEKADAGRRRTTFRRCVISLGEGDLVPWPCRGCVLPWMPILSV